MRTAVNGFIHARLEQAGLSPAPFTEQLADGLLGKRLATQSSVINPQSAIDFLRMAASFNHRGPLHQTTRGRQIKPDNRLLARRNRRRLETETLRDNALAVAGTLNPALGGPSIRVPLEPEIYEPIFTAGEPDGLWPTTPEPRQHGRRSLFLYNKQKLRLPLLEAFDPPDTLTSCPVRPASTFASQALILLSGTCLRHSAVAARLLRPSSADETNCVERAYRLALARGPTNEEWRMAVSFLRQQSEGIRERWPLAA
jgi:hypothetical protein